MLFFFHLVVVAFAASFDPAPEIKPTSKEKLLNEDKKFWFDIGEEYLTRLLKHREASKTAVAKNVVVLIGDGMGVSTITATRIYQGQREFGKSGEDHRLVYDDFPNVALVKTYNVDMQIPDSAGTATALFTGIKTRWGAVGVDVKSDKNTADRTVYDASKVEGIMTWAQKANKDTGIITTTRVTHATPACTYAQVHYRNWECDSQVPPDFKPFVKDIARQLIEDVPGNGFKVILGGGYQQFGHETNGSDDASCVRTDGLNLTKTWLNKHNNSVFVTTNEQLNDVGPDADYLLGLFYPGDLPYDSLRDKGLQGTPSLTQMTKKGLDILKKNPNGFVLMIEGGRIDHGNHGNQAKLALTESSEFEKTVAMVVNETGPDTLIIVTADHSHTLTINGYSDRGNDILGYGLSEYNKPALTLTYANGPGFAYHYTPNSSSILGPWRDVRNDSKRLTDPEYRHMATYELAYETHGGEDVALFATGPGAHLLGGVIEQNYVAHVISYAACIGPRATMNTNCRHNVNYTVKFGPNILFVLLAVTLAIYNYRNNIM